jgi:hypothetical protein
MPLPCSCIGFWNNLKLDSVPAELSGTYRQDADEPASIKYWLHQLKLGRIDLKTLHVRRRPPVDDIDAEIFSLLGKYPFASLQVIAEALAVSTSTVYSRLIERMGFKHDLLQWTPPVVREDLEQQRDDLSRELLQVLRSQQ